MTLGCQHFSCFLLVLLRFQCVQIRVANQSATLLFCHSMDMKKAMTVGPKCDPVVTASNAHVGVHATLHCSDILGMQWCAGSRALNTPYTSSLGAVPAPLVTAATSTTQHCKRTTCACNTEYHLSQQETGAMGTAQHVLQPGTTTWYDNAVLQTLCNQSPAPIRHNAHSAIGKSPTRV